MPTYRRIVEIEGEEPKSRFRVVRLDAQFELPPSMAAERWRNLIQQFCDKYGVQVRFVPPAFGQDLRNYMGPIPGEDTWEWPEEDFYGF